MSDIETDFDIAIKLIEIGETEQLTLDDENLVIFHWFIIIT